MSVIEPVSPIPAAPDLAASDLSAIDLSISTAADPLALPIDVPLPLYADPRDAFFDTSHLTKDLKRRTVRGGAVTLSAQGIKFVLRMGSTAILARLLTPADFGLIAMVTVVTGFVEMFKDAGLSMATVQREKITHAQVSTLFWINVGLSLVIMFAIAGLAPAIASIYNDHRLIKVTLAIASTMVLGGLTVQHQALLRRNMAFRSLATIEISAMLGGTLVAVFMAWRGYSYWSLVGLNVTSALITTAFSIAFSRWIPSLPSFSSGIAESLLFGMHYVGSSAISYFSRNGDNAIIGYRLGPTSLGLYNRAFALLLQPWQQLLAPINSVVEPALCRLAGKPTEFIGIYSKSLRLAAMITFPIAILMYLLAAPLVSFLLGSGWEPAIHLLRLMVPAAFVGGVRTAIGWLIFPLGRPERMTRWNAVSTPVLLLGFVGGSYFGAQGVAISLSIGECLLFLIGIRYAASGSFVPAATASNAIAPPLFASLIALWSTTTVSLFTASYISETIIFLLVYFACSIAHSTFMWRKPRDYSKSQHA